MGGLLGALRTAGTALQAQQTYMDVTSNNIANAQTPGYSREVANLTPTPPFPPVGGNMAAGAGQVGTGVQVASVTRDRSHFLDLQAWANSSGLNQQQTLQNTLTQIEGIFNEPSTTGLNASLSAFWQAWQTLSNNPSSEASRTAVVGQGQSLAQEFGSIASQLDQLQQTLDGTVTAQVASVNQIAGQIADINQQIAGVTAAGQSPNNLLDQRGQLLSKLSGIVSFQESQLPNGQDVVTVGHVNLVSGTQTTKLVAAPDPSNHNLQGLSWAGTTAPVELGAGTLQATIQLRDQTVPGYQGQLDTLAGELAAAVNGFANPTSAPAVSAVSGSGSLAAGTYTVGYTYTTAQGETASSPTSTVTVGTGQVIQVGTISLPAGATGVRYYLSGPGGTTLSLDATSASGAATTLTAPPAAGAAAPPAVGLGHEGGYGLGTQTGLPFFTGTTASTLAVNPTLVSSPDAVAAASGPNQPGDGSAALAIADLQNQALAGGTTIGQAYGALISGLGTASQTAGNQVKNQQLVQNRIQQEQQSVSGVDLNTQMTNLLAAQHAYQAAADVVTVVNEMLNTLVTGLGL